jgi:hypothetical protein
MTDKPQGIKTEAGCFQERSDKYGMMFRHILM